METIIKNKKSSRFKTFSNNLYAVKTIMGISKSRVAHAAFYAIIDYAHWLFFSMFFMRYVIGAIEAERPFNEIMLFVCISTIVFGTLAIYYDGYHKSHVLPFTNNKVYRVLYKKLYAKARNVELRCFEDAEFYNKYTMALENSSENMLKSVHNFFFVLFGIVAAGIGFSFMFTIDKYSIFFVVLPIIGNFFFGWLMSKIYTGRYSDNIKNSRTDGYVNRVMHLAEFSKEVRFSNVHKLMLARYRKAVENTLKIVDKYAFKASLFNALKNLLTFGLPFEGIMLYAAYRAMVSQTLGLAELAIMFSAMVSCSWILIGLVGNITEALKNGQFLEYFRAFMEYEEKIPEDGDGVMPGERVTSIEFRDVSFEYTAGEPIIKNLSFKISVKNKEKIIALVGHNGAGKTTIIKLLLRLYDPTSGEILVNNINIKSFNLKAYRKLFAAAFQDYKIMSLSVKDNVLMGSGDEKTVTKALKSAGILDKVMSLPKGIETVLTKEFDEEGANLSGGEIQKVIVARAFAQKAPVKVFDEPSSALDPIAEYQMYKGIMKESTKEAQDLTIFISHRLSSVKDADLVFMLENGAVIEQGNHEQLMKADREYAKMFLMQAQNYLAAEQTEEYINLVKEVV